MGSTFLDSFETDENGHFIFTTRLPEGQKADRVDFFVKDDVGNQKSLSLRIGEGETRVVEDVRLTIAGLPTKLNPGDVILISGTGNPGSALTAVIRTPDGETLTRGAIEINANGKWTFETLIPVNTPLGEYEAEISDGEDTILKSWTVESSKTLHITPAKIKYEAGDILKFNGTALPDENIEIILEGPQGTELFSDIIKTDKKGFFDFEIQSEHSFIDGTYILFGFQGESSDIVYVGLGVLPETQLVLRMDQLNYNAGDTAIISISGPESTLTLLILDPSDKQVEEDEKIILGPDGKKDYKLDLTDYGTGIYSAVLKLANSQTNELFSVGLKTATEMFELTVTKDSYEPGDTILILGSYPKNTLLTLTLLDPNGNEIKVKETFSNKEGGLSTRNTFKLPSDAEFGVWTVKATSGSHLHDVEILVAAAMEEGMTVLVEDIVSVPGLGVTVNIRVIGAEQRVTIEMFDDENELVDKIGPLSITGVGEVLTPWLIPLDLPPGKYTIRANDGVDSAETIFILE